LGDDLGALAQGDGGARCLPTRPYPSCGRGCGPAYTHGRGKPHWPAGMAGNGYGGPEYKPATTEIQPDGRISARGHARISTLMARQWLWEAGAPYDWREAICAIADQHLVPFWLIEKSDPRRVAIQTSWKGRADFLCLHAKADTLGRICEDQQGVLDNIALARESFVELDCLETPFAFANTASRVSFFEKADRDPYYAEYEDFRCRVTLMSGLPGSGKDHWVSKNRPDLPMVSLDIISLFRDYNARTEIVYIETGPDNLFSQNKSREDVVPQTAMEKLMRKLEPPQDWEAHSVIREVS